MTQRHRSIMESERLASHCVAWLIVLLLAALASQLLGFPGANGDRQALVEDEFTTPISAGQVGGTYSTGGQLRTVTDAESKASVVEGKLSFSGGKDTPAAGDPGVWWPAVTRANGLTVRGTLNQSATTTVGAFGFDADTSGTVSAGFSTAASGVLNFTDSAARNIGSYAAATDYPMAVQAGVSKWFAYLSESGIWKLKYISFLNVSDATIYPVLSGNTAAITLDDLDVRIRPLPVPLASDSFNRADGALGTTDGQGHAEMNGGAGVAWTVTDAGIQVYGNAFTNNTQGTHQGAYVTTPTPNIIAMADVYGTTDTYPGFWLRSDGVRLNNAGCDGLWISINILSSGKTFNVCTFVNNVFTAVSGVAISYVNGATATVILDGTEVRTYYNNAYVATTTVNESSINNNTMHGFGMASTTGTIYMDNFVLYARGNEGQYSYMGDRR